MLVKYNMEMFACVHRREQACIKSRTRLMKKY